MVKKNDNKRTMHISIDKELCEKLDSAIKTKYKYEGIISRSALMEKFAWAGLKEIGLA
tara:strand:+ start:84 stop:257 length:174 start_codon:yes stop_codon:yes gene_type:complete